MASGIIDNFILFLEYRAVKRTFCSYEGLNLPLSNTYIKYNHKYRDCVNNF